MKLNDRNMRRIAILGMGRSGTTFLTEFLGKCGVYLDEVNWAYEHQLGRLVNDTILVQQFGARPGLPYGKLPRDGIRLQNLDYWASMALFYIKYMDACAQVQGDVTSWAFKDPRTTVLYTVWVNHFDVIIGMYRPPQEVIASYLRQKWITGPWKRRIAMRYWKTFNRALLHIYRQYRQQKIVYILQYDENVQHRSTRLCEQLGLPITQEARSLFKSEMKHCTSLEFPNDSEAKEIYQALQAISMEKQ